MIERDPMSPPSRERMRVIEELFEDALDVAPADRGEWLAARCGPDSELLHAVTALLDAHARDDGIIDGAPFIAEPREPPERQIGPYRVLRELGRGGMGVVYLAERNDGQFRRRVAVKLLRDSSDAEELHRRFLAERQILASLSHPNIAQLLDGGVSEGQLPYLVIEYVDGVPLTEYCDRNRLGIDERLRLFLDVCAAVHHAHQNLVLHRDLKPGNVLVTTGGTVKLLDFGVAKLLNPTLGGAFQPVTMTAFSPMTPAYASPEQVRGDSLSTASDVYALGLLLYELLTGYQAQRIDPDGVRSIADVVCDTEPDRPSTIAVRGMPDATGAPSPRLVAELRGETPERLRRKVRGDLDAIVMMALRKEPARRYGSAELLAGDIVRYLEGLPVLAHRGSRGYRLGKLLARHRVAATAAMVGAIALLGGASVSLWQRSIAVTERARAERALQESQEVTAFLLGLFEGNDPAVAAGAATTARELLERGAQHADDLSSQPHVQSRMFGVLARVYLSLGELDQAEQFARRMHRVSEVEDPGPSTAQALLLLGEVRRRRGDYDSAAALMQGAANLVALTRDETSRALSGEALLALSGIHRQRSDLPAAEQAARSAHATHAAAYGVRDHRTISSLSTLASILRDRGEMRAAESYLRDAVQLREAAGATSSEERLQLAELLARDSVRGREAEQLLRRVIREERASTNGNTLAKAHDALAVLLERQGRVEEAIASLEAIVAIREQMYGTRHAAVSGALAHLGGLLRRTGRLTEAEAAYRRMASLDQELLGSDHPNYAGTLTVLAVVMTERGRHAEADSLLRIALRIRETRLGHDHVLVAKTLRRMAELQLALGAYAEAEAGLQRALAIVSAQRTPESDDVREVHETFVRLYERWDREADAVRHRRLAQGGTPATE